MNNKPGKKTAMEVAEHAPEAGHMQKEFMFAIAPGVQFDDIYITTAELARQLSISKKKVLNMKSAGKLSYTCLEGTLYFYKQEIAAIMEKHRVSKTRSMILTIIIMLGQALTFCTPDGTWLPWC